MFEEPLQFAAVLIMTSLFIFGHTIGVLFSIYLLLTPLYGFTVVYLLWTYCFDMKTPAKGGRRSETFRRLKSWEHFRDYFPVRLIRTKRLDPKKNYILGYHPHGIMCAGAWANFATEATGFSSLFPGIKSHLLTLTCKWHINLFSSLHLFQKMWPCTCLYACTSADHSAYSWRSVFNLFYLILVVQSTFPWSWYFVRFKGYVYQFVSARSRGHWLLGTARDILTVHICFLVSWFIVIGKSNLGMLHIFETGKSRRIL